MRGFSSIASCDFPAKFLWLFPVLRRNSLAYVFLGIFLVYGGGGVFGQNSGVNITSSEQPGPTDANPIPIELNFEDGVDELDLIDFEVLNGEITNIIRVEPQFNYIGTERGLKNFQVETTEEELFTAGLFGIPEYLLEKLKETVISIDFNNIGELFYLTLNEGIFRIDNDGNAVSVISGNEFESPLDMVINRDNGNIYVADSGKGQILIFNSDYDQLDPIGTGLMGDSNSPRGATGLALDDAGNVYVADNFTGNTVNQDAIKIYAPNGNLIKKISTYNGQQIHDPYRIAVDKYRNIYVSESGGGQRPRIIIFDKDYNPVKVIQGGEQGNPGSLVVDSFGYLYVIDYENDFNLTDLFNEPLKVLENYETIRDSQYTVNVFDTNQDFSFVKQFNRSALNLPVDLAIDECEGIYLNNLRLQGDPPRDFFGFPALMDINFDFTLKRFQRQDNFTAEIVPEEPGLVEVILEDSNFFKCGPQPEGDFSIIYEPEEEENRAPVAEAETYEVNQNQVLIRGELDGVLANDEDPDGDALTAEIENTVSNGNLIFNPDGSFTYQPDPGYVGTDFFTYVASDGELDSSPATVTISVTPVAPANTAPVAVSNTYSIAQDELLTIGSPGVLGNDNDEEGDALTAEIENTVSNGNLILNPDGSFSYQPNPGYVGTDSFTYVANDGELDSSPATVTITVTPVAPANTAPVAVNNTYSIAQDELLTIGSPGVLGNDNDEEGDALTAEIENTVSNGTLIFNPDGSFTYQPNPGYVGTDFFTYVASDGELDSSPATVTITVTPVAPANTAPVAVNNTYSIAQDELLTIGSHGVLGNDNDEEGDALTAELVTNVTNGVLSLDPDGSFVYQPDLGYFGEDSFTYVASDGNFNSNPAKVIILIEANAFSCLTTITLPLDENGEAQLEVDQLYEGELGPGGTATVDKEIFTCADLGVQTVTLEYSGNSNGSCSIQVTVVDEIAPIPEVRDLEVILDENGAASITPEDLNNGSTDNCGNSDLQFAVDQTIFLCSDVGTNTVVFSVTDTNGNTASIDVSIRVSDPLNNCAVDPVVPPEKSFVVLFPNPSEGQIQIASSSDILLERVELFDIRGRFLDALELTINPVTRSYHLDLRKYQTGIYTLKFYSVEREYIRRAIITTY